VVIAGVVALLGIAMLVEYLIETPTEAASGAFTDFHAALADRDGGRACALMSTEAQQQAIAIGALATGATDCPTAIEASPITDEQTNSLRDIDPEKVGDHLKVNGDEATFRVDLPLVNIEEQWIKRSGDWKIASLTGQVELDAGDADATTEESIRAADVLCADSFQDQQLVLEEIASSPRTPAQALQDDFVRTSTDLIADLRKFPVGDPGAAVRPLLAPLQAEADAKRRVTATFTADAEAFDRASAVLVAANRATADAAAAAGFSAAGCAASPSTP
jgi:hypothetical protein